jgi:hypothetical protein
MFAPFRCRLLVLTAAALISANVATSRAADEKLIAPPAKVEKCLGAPVVKLLQSCTKVESFRINPVISTEAGKEYVCGYKVIGRGKEMGKDFAVRLTNVLYAETTWFGLNAGCFEPGVVFRLWCDKEWVDVILCFRCTNLIVKDSLGREIGEVHAGFGDTVSETTLIKMAKESFPDDKDIQALVEKKK